MNLKTIKQKKKEKGLTVSELALVARTSKDIVRNFLEGKFIPFDDLFRLCLVLGLDFLETIVWYDGKIIHDDFSYLEEFDKKLKEEVYYNEIKI